VAGWLYQYQRDAEIPTAEMLEFPVIVVEQLGTWDFDYRNTAELEHARDMLGSSYVVLDMFETFSRTIAS
jgi:hypothetical protein